MLKTIREILLSKRSSLVQMDEPNRRKKFSVSLAFNTIRRPNVRYVRFQTKQIVAMFGLWRKKASLCSVLQDLVCSVFKSFVNDQLFSVSI